MQTELRKMADAAAFSAALMKPPAPEPMHKTGGQKHCFTEKKTKYPKKKKKYHAKIHNCIYKSNWSAKIAPDGR